MRTLTHIGRVHGAVVPPSGGVAHVIKRQQLKTVLFLLAPAPNPSNASERIGLCSSCVKVTIIIRLTCDICELFHGEEQQSSWRDWAQRKERQQQRQQSLTILSASVENKKCFGLCNPLFSATLFGVEELGPLFECRLTLLRNTQANTRLAALAR